MIYSEPARTPRRIRIRWIRIAGLLLAVVAIVAALDHQPQASSSSNPAPPPVLGGLDADLLLAVHTAAVDAARDGVDFHIESGRRSPAYQQQLLDAAVAKYGSAAEAARWVATPGTSPHVSGDAVDIGPSGAAAWLSANGAGYGLCRIYDNEPWHYELRREAIDHGCPPTYPDPTFDPRMQK